MDPSKECIHALWRAGDPAAQFMMGMARRVDRAVAVSISA